MRGAWQTGPTDNSLKFAMVPDSSTLAAFALSYHYVQTNWHLEEFTMKIDGNSIDPVSGWTPRLQSSPNLHTDKQL